MQLSPVAKSAAVLDSQHKRCQTRLAGEKVSGEIGADLPACI